LIIAGNQGSNHQGVIKYQFRQVYSGKDLNYRKVVKELGYFTGAGDTFYVFCRNRMAVSITQYFINYILGL